MIVLNLYPILHVNYLYLGNIYKVIMVVAKYLMVLSNLEINDVYLLNTINIDQDKHRLFSIMDRFSMLVLYGCINP